MVIILIRSDTVRCVWLVLIWPNYIFQRHFGPLKYLFFRFFKNYLAPQNNITKENWVCFNGGNVKKSVLLRDS